MQTDTKTITMRQALIIYLMATLSPAIRLFPTGGSEIGKMAGWVSPIIGSVGLAALFYLLSAIFKNEGIESLPAFFELTLGKVLAKLLLCLYFLWIFLLFFLYIRYYAERLLSSIFPDTDLRFFVIVMMLLVFMAARGRLSVIARFSELSILIMTAIIAVLFLFLCSVVKISNLLPLTQNDFVPAVKATVPFFGIWGYATFLFFFGDQIVHRDKLRQYSRKVILFQVIFAVLLMVFIVGTLGYQVARRMLLPFFLSVKMISFIETLDRFESVLMAVWIICDFLIITFFAFVLKGVLKHLFCVTKTKYYAAPLALAGYVGSQYIASTRFELETFSRMIAMPMNIALCFAVPLVVFFIAKVRRKI